MRATYKLWRLFPYLNCGRACAKSDRGGVTPRTGPRRALLPTSNISMRLQHQDLSSSLYGFKCDEISIPKIFIFVVALKQRWMYESVPLSQRQNCLKPNQCKYSKAQYVDISQKTDSLYSCSRQPDWALMISASWKVSGSLSQHHYCASGCRGRRRKSSVNDVEEGGLLHSPHTHQVKHIREG